MAWFRIIVLSTQWKAGIMACHALKSTNEEIVVWLMRRIPLIRMSHDNPLYLTTLLKVSQLK